VLIILANFAVWIANDGQFAFGIGLQNVLEASVQTQFNVSRFVISAKIRMSIG